MPSRSPRSTAVDYGKGNVPEVDSPTCEPMQIVVPSPIWTEISERVSKMIAGTNDGKAVTFGELRNPWRITGILADAVAGQDRNRDGSPVYVLTVARPPTCPSAFRRWSPWNGLRPCMTWSS